MQTDHIRVTSTYNKTQKHQQIHTYTDVKHLSHIHSHNYAHICGVYLLALSVIETDFPTETIDTHLCSSTFPTSQSLKTSAED